MRFIDRVVPFIPATVPASTTRLVNIPYLSNDNPRNQLDIYLPAQIAGPYPVILDLFGGGLYFGQKSSHKLNPSLRFLQDGFAIVSMNYSLSWQHIFPHQIVEIQAALQFLTIHAADYQLDMKRLSLIGESSGAQLAVLSSSVFSAKATTVNGVALNNFYPTIKQVIGMYGPYQVDLFPKQFQTLNLAPKFEETGQAGSFEGQMFGGLAPRDIPKQVKQANPETFFTENMPPLMLIAGTNDQVVPYLQSVNLAREYHEKAGRPAELIVVPNGQHGPDDYNNKNIYQKKLEFLKQKSL